MESTIGVIMRVPGLFIIDYWWQHDRYKSLSHSTDLSEILNCVATNIVLLHGFLLLLLPLRHLQALYTHFISGVLIFSCHMLSKSYIDVETNTVINNIDDIHFLRRQIGMFVLHCCLGGLVTFLIKGPWMFMTPIFSIYVIPIIARVAGLPIDTLQFFQSFCDAITGLNVFLYITSQIPTLVDCAKLAYMDAVTVLEIHGLGTLFSLLRSKLFVPTHFALFWLIEFFVQLIGSMYQVDTLGLSDRWYLVLLATVSSICASPVTLMATSVSVSYLSFFILCSTRAYLQGFSAMFHDNPMHSGWTEALTLILLAVQTGIMEMKMPGRMGVMTIILFIVMSSLLQAMLEIAEPVVLALSASRSRHFWRHFRALSLCFALLVFPLYLTRILSAVFPIDFWMMVVLSSCTLTSVQVLDLLVVHCLFVYDSVRFEPWENLDDIVYYTRAVTKVLEFFVAIFVVAMGLWESTLGKWNWVNASILLVHCYFNVWQRLQTGWKSFLLRREAARKAKSLPSATDEQLSRLDDVCSICFGSMKAACVTPCTHFFHRTCLRKWLYVQDKCPLCHSVVNQVEDPDPRNPNPQEPVVEEQPAP